MPSSRQNPGVDAEALAQRTLALVDIPSESRREAEIGAYVRASIPLPVLYDDGDVVLFGHRRQSLPLVVLAGHLDTVPAQNIVPAEAIADLNYRYAPNRGPEEAESVVRGLVRDGEIVALANSPPARVVVDTPLLRRLRAAGSFAVKPKQAWTPVAEFAAG